MAKVNGPQYATEHYCKYCDGWPMIYHEWPAINPATGEHMGNYRLYECMKCKRTYDPNTGEWSKKK